MRINSLETLRDVLILVVVLFGVLGPRRTLAATVVKSTAKAVVIEFDSISENFSTGDRLVGKVDDAKIVLIEVTQVKNNRLLGRILSGKVSEEMKIEKQDVVTSQANVLPAAPASTSATTPPTAPSTTPAPTADKLTAAIIIASSNVFRGIPASDNRTIISGGFDYVNSGLTGGFYFTNSPLPSTSVATPYLGWNFNRIDWSAGVNFKLYSYAKNHGIDSFESKAKISFRSTTFEISHIPKFFGVETEHVYSNLSTRLGIGNKLLVTSWVGYSSFSNEVARTCRSYFDYKVGLAYASSEFNIELAYTDTNRTDLNGKTLYDNTTTAIFKKTF